MREADRFFGIIQNHAVANIFNRPTLEIDGVSYLICTIHDLEKAVNLYFSDEARKTIFSKIPTNQIKFFEKVILPLKKEWPGDITTARMQKKYKEVFDEPISTITINHHYLQPLENMDFISRDVDPNDKRRKLTEPLRDKVFDREAQIYGLFKDDHILTLEMLKEQYSKLKQLMTKDTRYNTVKIKDYDDAIIDVETLYNTYCMHAWQWPWIRKKKEQEFHAHSVIDRLEEEGFKPLIKADILEGRVAEVRETLKTQLEKGDLGAFVDNVYNLFFSASSAWLRSMENKFLARKVNAFLTRYNMERDIDSPVAMRILVREGLYLVNLSFANLDVEPLRPILINTVPARYVREDVRSKKTEETGV